jgi:hypothetical protein
MATLENAKNDYKKEKWKFLSGKPFSRISLASPSMPSKSNFAKF